MNNLSPVHGRIFVHILEEDSRSASWAAFRWCFAIHFYFVPRRQVANQQAKNGSARLDRGSGNKFTLDRPVAVVVGINCNAKQEPIGWSRRNPANGNGKQHRSVPRGITAKHTGLEFAKGAFFFCFRCLNVILGGWCLLKSYRVLYKLYFDVKISVIYLPNSAVGIKLILTIVLLKSDCCLQ